jgi:hypothetical protein
MISPGRFFAEFPEKTPPGGAGLSDLLAFGCQAENIDISAPDISIVNRIEVFN